MSEINDLSGIRKYLAGLKTEYERNNRRSLVEFSDRELDDACKALLDKDEGTYDPSAVEDAPEPHRKAKDNSLTDESVKVIDDFLNYNSVVQGYFESIVVDRPDYPEKLRDIFLEKYWKLAKRKVDPLHGDALFKGIIDETTRGKKKYIFPICALLVYFFARCEVFPPKPGEEELKHDLTH